MTSLHRSCIAKTLPRFSKQNLFKNASANTANAMRRLKTSQASAGSGQLVSHLSPVWGHLTTMQPVKGEGIYLWDADGTKYTDFTSGIGVTNLGHTHPKITKAIQEQAT